MQTAKKTAKMGMNIQALSRQDKAEGVQVRAVVQSQSDGRRHYTVIKRQRWMCDCPHWVFRKPHMGCKHIAAVRAAIA